MIGPEPYEPETYSPDGRYRWDGMAWQPVAPTVPTRSGPNRTAIVALVVVVGVLALILIVVIAKPTALSTVAPTSTTSTTSESSSTSSSTSSKRERFYDLLRDNGAAKYTNVETEELVELLCEQFGENGIETTMAMAEIAGKKNDVPMKQLAIIIRHGATVYCPEYLPALDKWSKS